MSFITEKSELLVYYYVERDGKVYLEEKSGILKFPTDKNDIPFQVIEKKNMNFGNYEVIYCGAELDLHPEHWRNKDDLPKLDNLDRIVRQCLHMSFPRCVAEAFITNDDKVLLVNASRGVTKGFWNLPGGFMEYGESPSECIIREIKEEIGLDAEVVRLIDIYTKASAFHPFYLIAFVYEIKTKNYDFKLDPDEIAEVNWFDVDEALNITKSLFTKLALTDFKTNRSRYK